MHEYLPKKRKGIHKIIKRRIVVAVSVFCLLLTLNIVTIYIINKVFIRKPDPAPRGNYSTTVDFTDQRIQELMKQYHLPSVAVTLIDDQETVWQEVYGFADVQQEIPATTDTVYKSWSVAKVFTAIETMRLVEEGLVDLDAPISDYLPGFTIQSRFLDSAPITVRSILSHHGGLPRNECNWLSSVPGDRDVLKEIFESLPFCHTAFPTGERYKYTNLGPDLLGHLIEVMRGESFASYMQKNVLARIDMEDSAFLSTGIPEQKKIALGYEYHKREFYPLEQVDITSIPSGNLYTTLDDMNTFVKFIFREGNVNGEQIIEPATLQLMFENQYPNSGDPQTMGLGWKTTRILGTELLVWHDGGPGEGIGTLVAMLPERKLGIVIFANEVSFEGNISIFLATEILQRMLEVKTGVLPPAKTPPQKVEIDQKVLESYAGRYIVFGQVIDIVAHADRLKAAYRGIKLDLIPVDENRFVFRHGLLDIGLTDLLKIPMDLRELEIIFPAVDEDSDQVMVINFGEISFEVCPRYPEFTEIVPLWQELAREYELSVRLHSGYPADEVFGRDEIVIQDGVLMMPGVIGPLKTISETEIIILSGPFAGETMLYDPETGYIRHQWVVYKPMK